VKVEPSSTRLSIVSSLGTIEEDEQHPGRLGTSVAPGVVRSELDDDVARPESYLALQDRPDLAAEHDTIVDGLRPMHKLVRRARVGGGRRYVLVRHRVLFLSGGMSTTRIRLPRFGGVSSTGGGSDLDHCRRGLKPVLRT
jgi:hypothetical protein